MSWFPKDPLQFVRGCGLAVRVTPTPITFAERRSVLQVLERHGSIEVFQMVPGRNNLFLSLTKQEKTAQVLQNLSPLTYKVSNPQTKVDAGSVGLGRLPSPGNGLESPAVTQDDLSTVFEEDQPADTESAQERRFTLHAFPVDATEHDEYKILSPLRNAWPKEYNSPSLVAATLKQSLPKALGVTGLSQWLQDFDDKGFNDKNEAARRIANKPINYVPGVIKADSEEKKAEIGSFPI